MGRAHLATWEQFLNEFAKSPGGAHCHACHATMVCITCDWTCRSRIWKWVMGMGDGSGDGMGDRNK